MNEGRPDDVDTCDARRREATTPQDEKRYLLAPADSPHPEVVLETFERAFGEVRTQDAPNLIRSLMRNRLAGPEVWRALTGRWGDAMERFPVTSYVGMVSSVHTFVADPAFAAEVRRFHTTNPVPVGQQQLDQLQAIGCTEMQGYLFSHARPAADIVRLFLEPAKTASA